MPPSAPKPARSTDTVAAARGGGAAQRGARGRDPAGPVQEPVALAPVRRRGRPPRRDNELANPAPQISREQILERATELARNEPLGEISMVGLARELGVAPTLIHYYVGSHDDLISGVVNRYFRERAASMPALTGDWKEDLRADALHTFRMNLEYGGVVRYTMSHNRFRLFQRVGPGETDFGILYLNRIAETLRRGGFTPQQAALGYHLVQMHVMASAYAEISKQLPAYHEHYIREQIAAHPLDEFVGAHYIAEAFASLDSETAFPVGLQLLIDGFARWLPAAPAPAEGGGKAGRRRTAPR